MFKKTLLIVASCIFAFCLTATVSSAQNTGPESIVLKTAKAKKPALFPHREHQSRLPCSTCHHTKNADGTQGPYVEGKEAKCITCHNKKDMKNKKLVGYKNVGHARCKGCHKKEKKAGNKKATTSCSGCHKKGLK